MYVLYLLLCLCLAVVAYIRLAPHEVARWHLDPEVTEDQFFKGGAKIRVQTGQDGLAQLDHIARAEPRTAVLAGSIHEGMITYISRTKMIGFPDYTTVKQTPEGLEIYGRLRFGRSDFGVNATRIERWVRAMGQA